MINRFIVFLLSTFMVVLLYAMIMAIDMIMIGHSIETAIMYPPVIFSACVIYAIFAYIVISVNLASYIKSTRRPFMFWRLTGNPSVFITFVMLSFVVLVFIFGGHSNMMRRISSPGRYAVYTFKVDSLVGSGWSQQDAHVKAGFDSGIFTRSDKLMYQEYIKLKNN